MNLCERYVNVNWGEFVAFLRTWTISNPPKIFLLLGHTNGYRYSHRYA